MGGRHRAHEWSSRDGLVVAAALVVGVVAAGLTQDAARSTGIPAAQVVRATDVAEHTPQTLTSSTSVVDLVQALPGPPVEVQIDGKTVGQRVALGKVVGPLRLSAGMHQVRFVGAATTAASVTVKPGAVHDVVLHAPAAAGGTPWSASTGRPRDDRSGQGARAAGAHGRGRCRRHLGRRREGVQQDQQRSVRAGRRARRHRTGSPSDRPAARASRCSARYRSTWPRAP